MIRNAGLFWVHKTPAGEVLNRIFTPTEMLLANAFPVTPELGNPGGKPFRGCSFCPPSGRKNRKGSHMTNQSGNAMNVAVCMAVYIFMILCIRRADQFL